MTTFPITATTDEVVAETKAIAAERPNYVYVPPDGKVGETTSCAYFHDDGPGCIVGQWLARRGVTREDLAAVVSPYSSSGETDDLNTEIGATGLCNYGVIDVPKEALGFLITAQGQQDEGTPWGQAVKDAERRLDQNRRSQ